VNEVVSPGSFRRNRLAAIDAAHVPKIKELERALASASGDAACKLAHELFDARIAHQGARSAVDSVNVPRGHTVVY
jgi:hypothetical protein